MNGRARSRKLPEGWPRKSLQDFNEPLSLRFMSRRIMTKHERAERNKKCAQRETTLPIHTPYCMQKGWTNRPKMPLDLGVRGVRGPAVPASTVVRPLRELRSRPSAQMPTLGHSDTHWASCSLSTSHIYMVVHQPALPRFASHRAYIDKKCYSTVHYRYLVLVISSQ